MTFKTRLTNLLNIDVPIMSAGMAGVAGPRLVAAVSNAGGIGTLGAIGMSPKVLRECIQEARSLLDPGKPMGVDLLLPKIGGGARATNKDYTGGQLEALIDIMVTEHIELFVCAVGVPPRWVVDRLHDEGIAVMNMVGSPRHIPHCLEAGVDIICAQGTEAGGHTGDISTLVLIPQVVDLCAEHEVIVVGAGGVYDGRGIAACMALGAEGVWLGSKFIMTPEANAPRVYKRAIEQSRSDDTMRTEIYTGRPMRGLANAYMTQWERGRQQEKYDLLKTGTVPFLRDLAEGQFPDNVVNPIPIGFRKVHDLPDSSFNTSISPVAVGQACGALNRLIPAGEVVQSLSNELKATFEKLFEDRAGQL